MLSVGPIGKSVSRLGQGLFGEIHIALATIHLIGGGLQVQQGVAHVLFDLRPQILQLLAAAIQLCVGHQSVAVRSVPRKNGNVHGRVSRESAM